MAAAAPAAAATNGDLAFHVYEFGSYDIYTRDAETGERTNLTADSEGYDTSPDWSPDGSRIAFTSSREGGNEVYVMNADGSNVRRLTHGVDVANDVYDESYAPRWSPDGSKISYTFAPSSGDREIYVMDPDGANKTNITGPHEDGFLQWDDYIASWSPDGSQLVFGAIRFADEEDGGVTDIVIANADGTGQRRLGDNGDNAEWIEYPQFSPDGTAISYMAGDHNGSNWDIWVVRPDGTGRRNLTNHPAGDTYATWSADGSQIFFTSNRAEGFRDDIYVMDYEPEAATASAARAKGGRSARARAAAAPVRVATNGAQPDVQVLGATTPPPPVDALAATANDGGIAPAALKPKLGQTVTWTFGGTGVAPAA